MSTSLGLFLDRDGTLIVDRDYLRNCADVKLIRGTGEAIGILRALHCHLFLFTNQSGVSRGLLTLEDVERCNGEMVRQIGFGQIFDHVCIATEGPDDVPVYRKPSPRFIDEMVDKFGLNRKFCYMVGDKSSDLLAGMNAGIEPVFVHSGKPPTNEVDDLIHRKMSLEFDDLLAFAKYLRDLNLK
ncbi:MAG: HAD-IIIA family hydrolase [Puniceicoccales bacterium]|jgi:D-glycero-D-manno-heptose 1,7-bisphosphate phosphatase|nr:HAD-IIIA family hydrolase [Puniceicoccales bacterium]